MLSSLCLALLAHLYTTLLLLTLFPSVELKGLIAASFIVLSCFAVLRLVLLARLSVVAWASCPCTSSTSIVLFFLFGCSFLWPRRFADLRLGLLFITLCRELGGSVAFWVLVYLLRDCVFLFVSCTGRLVGRPARNHRSALFARHASHPLAEVTTAATTSGLARGVSVARATPLPPW